MLDWTKLDSLVRKWLEEAGERIHQSFDRPLEISTKTGRNDLVTIVDKETEKFFIERIQSHFPGHRIIGEEGQTDRPDSLDGIIWVIDPIDGTMNFVHQRKNFAISIGIYEDGVGQLGYIFDVVHRELYFARRGGGAFFNHHKLPPLGKVSLENALIGLNANWIAKDPSFIPIVREAHGTRSFGSAAIEMGYVACGWLDAYINVRLAPWDWAAGKIIVEELGGKVTKLNGESLSLMEKSNVLIARPGLHEEIVERYLAGHRGE
jgi:Inositol monophosphatase family.